MRLYRKPKEKRTPIEASWFSLIDEKMPLAFWASVSPEIRRKRIPRNQKSKLKALIEEYKNAWILERSGK